MIDLIREYGISYLWTDGYRWTGVAVTLWLLIISVTIGFCLSVPLAVARVSSKKRFWLPVWTFSYVFRGTPLYVQLLVFYTGVYTLQFVRDTEFLNWFFRSGYNCVLIALVLNTCAYTTEIFAGAMRETKYGEVEAAKAYGFSSWKMYTKIIIPSALRRALPAYSNEVIMMLHSTSLAFAATVPDLLKIARDVNSATYMSFQAFGIAAVLYLIISFILIGLFKRAEKHWLKHLKPVTQQAH
ncbi:ABC transporter permease [Vibrio sp.]|uniref:Histidine/lysine/arginine/ornithine transport system permease protein HisM n=1 Tax=Vibrio viridaestus TaxID=2487322 RepID=A0A3N9TE92_9VIBR|nr:ABC transporter permease [Vibrio viridaestus]MDC0609183.1 ABC transporter permease [Vibrio sp.]RQW62340.1 histidine ABC transporter permease HisM [Vibrio viridaestus]